MAASRFSRRTLLGGSAATALGVLAAEGLGAISSAAPAPLRVPGSRPNPLRPAGYIDDTLPFDHVVVVMMENHSFDNYFGMLPLRGQPLADGFTFDAHGVPLNANPLHGGAQRSFRLRGTCQPNGVNQSWNDTHTQINGGRMDGFAVTDPEAMGYWDEADIPFYYSLANAFCLGNRNYCSAPAQTYPNRRFLYSGTAMGTVSSSPSGFTLPYPGAGTLMDVLTKHNVSWRNYFTDLPALAIIPGSLSRHPLNFSPITQFFTDCLTGRLPAVSFVDPEFGLLDVVGGYLQGYLSKVPDLPPVISSALNNLQNKLYAQGGDEENPQDIALGEAFVSQVTRALVSSPQWERTLFIWTYDEHGGYYDHVPPVAAVAPDPIAPMIGPSDVQGGYTITGLRVPTVVASPYARPHSVTNVPHDHTSIIATIARKWNLPAITYRDANATTLLDFLDLNEPPAMLHPPRLAAAAKPTLGLSGCMGTSPTPIITSSALMGQRRTAAHTG